MEDIKPVRRIRNKPEEYMACPICDDEITMKYSSWVYDLNVHGECSCGVWEKRENSIGEKVWAFRDRTKDEDKRYKNQKNNRK